MHHFPHATRSKAGRTNIIALSGSVLQAAYKQEEKKLNTEEKELLTELIDVIFNEGNVDAKKKFERGYRLGVLMTAEIFMEQDTFL